MENPTHFSMSNLALFLHDPECSIDCCDGIIMALEPEHTIQTFSEEEIDKEFLSKFDMVIFPGGIGDASSFDQFFRYKQQRAIHDYLDNGGKYLGICMGAYWAGEHYFDILGDVEAVQYIKRPNADIKRSYGTVAPITWKGVPEEMFFYDGCALIGEDTNKVALYSNGDSMAIIKGNVGVIGCHPESLPYWYCDPYKYLELKWHDYRHHVLLKQFVNELLRG